MDFLWPAHNLTDTIWMLCLILLIHYIIQCIVTYRKVPPGPWGLPFIGYLPFLDKDTTTVLKHLKNKYGEIFSLKLGQRFAVVLSSWETGSEAYIKQAEVFAGRPSGFTKLGWYFNFKALTSKDGIGYKEQKKMLLRSFRDFGFGKLSLEGKIQEEADNMTLYLKEHKYLVDLDQIFNIVTTNIVCTIMFGKRYDFDDPKLRRLVKYVHEIMNSIDQVSLVELFPTFSFLPERLMGLGHLTKAKEDLKEFVDEIIDEHIETFDETNIRDVVDDYLLKMKELEIDFSDEETQTFCSRSYLRENLIMMFIGGTETTATILHWGIKYMLIYPEIQRKVQEEIDAVIGRSGLPSWNDKLDLPFTEATINEIQRKASIVTIANAHSNREEAFINGYKIPKRSYILLNLLEIHYDPSLWKDPEKFNPYRFLDENGKVFKPEYLIPFSMGMRLCLGHSLAKMEILIFFVSLLQNFNFTSDREETEDFKVIDGLVRKLAPYPVNIKQR